MCSFPRQYVVKSSITLFINCSRLSHDDVGSSEKRKAYVSYLLHRSVQCLLRFGEKYSKKKLILYDKRVVIILEISLVQLETFPRPRKARAKAERRDPSPETKCFKLRLSRWKDPTISPRPPAWLQLNGAPGAFFPRALHGANWFLKAIDTACEFFVC